MACKYYIKGKYSQLYTELYSELESGTPNIKKVYEILNKDILTTYKGQWYVKMGDSHFYAMQEINRINSKYPGLIETKYHKDSYKPFGKANNKIYKASINRFVLDSIVPDSEQATIIAESKEERREILNNESILSEQVRADNTSEQSKGIVGQNEERSVTENKADRLKANFAKVGVNVEIEFTDELADNVSGDVVGDGTRKAKIRLNENYLLDDTVYHEFGHVFVDLLGLDNVLVRQALKELKGSTIEKTVTEAYPDLSGARLQKEILATAIGEQGAKIERSNPSKLQVILNKIFRAIGKIFGVEPNAAAVLAEQMFAGEIRRDALSGQVSSLVQESRTREKLDKLITETKILARNMANIARSRGNEASLARAEKLMSNLEQVKQLEDFIEFIDTAGKATATISNKFKIIEDKIRDGEVITSEDMANIVDLKQYLDGFEVLKNLSVAFTEDSKLRAVPLEKFTNTQDKLRAIIAEREALEVKYFEIGIPALADKLLPFAVNEINEQLDVLIDNIRTQKTASRHIETNDKRYAALNKQLKADTITKEEFDQGVEDLAIQQLQEKKSSRENLIALLTKASRDKSKFSMLLDPLMYSNDNAIQLFTKLVKNALYEADNSSKDFLYKLQEAYREFVVSPSVSENNVEQMNRQMTEDIVEYVYSEKSGKYEPITRVAFIQEYDVPRYKANRREAVEKASEKTNYYTSKDFATEEEFERYLADIEATRKGGYAAARKAFNSEMQKWFSKNTAPVKGAIETAKKHEEKIRKVVQEISKLQEKTIKNEASPTEIEKLTVLEIELENLNRWKNQNYYIDRFGDQSTPIVKGGLVRPSLGEPGPSRSNKTNYSNPRYTALQNNPKLKKYYDFLWNSYKDAQDKLGKASNRMSKNPWDTYSYMIPSIRKTDKDRAIENGIVPLAKELWKEGTDIVSTDVVYGDRLKGIGGEEYKLIPVFYTNPLDKKDISYDLAGSMAQFTHMANMFEGKSKIQAEVQLMLDVIGHRETSLTSPMGTEVMDVIAKQLGYDMPITKAGTETNNFKHLQSFVDNVFFGEKSIKQQFSFMGKTFEANKMSGMLAGYTAMNSLSFNVLQAVNQSTLDNILGYAESIAGQFYNQKSWARGKKTYWANAGALSDVGKIAPESWLGQLVQMYDPIQGEFRDNVGRNVTGTKAKKLFTSNALFFLQHGAEHELQVSRMLAMMDFVKAKDKDGKQLKNKDGSDMTMMDAHTKNKDGRVRIDPRVANFNAMDFMNRMHGLNKRTNGVYNDFDKAHLKRLWYGKLVLLFRGWMVPGIRRRYGHGEIWHADQEMGTLTQGTYHTFYKLLRDSLIKMQNQYPTMTEVEQQNVKRVMVEMGAFLSTIAIFMGLSMDDDEEKNYAITFILYQARRLQTELGAFSNPREALRLVQSPSAGIRPIENAVHLFDAIWKNGLYFGSGGNIIDEKDIYYQRTQGKFNKGDLKIQKTVEKLIPALNGVEKSKNAQDALNWFNK
tara:strand:- start:2236 stop:6678 length:4443 start_codon:yes stop_codon:yes gene_type:complete